MDEEREIENHSHGEHFLRLFYRGLLPIVLLGSGMALLFLHLPGWSLIFGLPMIVIGSVFLIDTYDDLIQKTVDPYSKEVVDCVSCGEPTPKIAGLSEKHTFCASCKKKFLKEN